MASAILLASYPALAETIKWSLWEQDVRQPSAGIRNARGASIEVIDSNAYYGASCTEYRPNDDGTPSSQSSVVFSIPKQNISPRLYRESTGKTSDDYFYKAVIYVHDGYEATPLLYRVRSEITSYDNAVRFYVEPHSQESLNEFRDLINALRSGNEVGFQIMPKNDNDNNNGLPEEHFTLRGSSAALQNILRDCDY